MTPQELTTSILNTLLVIPLVLGLAMPLGVALAILLFRTNVFGRKFLWIALGSQIAVPLYVFAGGWSAGLGFQGWITSFGLRLSDVLGNAEAGSWGALFAVSAIHGLAAIPWVALFLSIGLLWVHRGEEEQAYLDGGLMRVVISAILPRCPPWLMLAAFVCIVPVMTEMVVSNLYQLPTVAEQIYLDVSLGSISPLTYLSAFFLCLAPVAAGFAILLRRLPAYQLVNQKNSHFVAKPFPLGKWRAILSLCVWLVVLGLVGLPLLNLIAKAGWRPSTNSSGETVYGWSLERLMTTASEALTLSLPEFYWSLVLAFFSSSFSLCVAVALYRFTAARARGIVSLAMLTLLSVPGPLVGISIIFILNRSTPTFFGYLYDHTIAAPLLAQQFRILPFAWFTTNMIFASISRSTRQQAILDGLSRWEYFQIVLWPQTKLRWLAGWLLLLVMSVGELSCSILVLPPGVTTISMKLFEMLHFGMRHQDSGLCFILFAFGWLVSFAFWKTLSER